MMKILREKSNSLVSSVEKQWLSLLYHHCRQTFGSTFLPSHDHLHHFRVWHFARQVFAALDQAGRPVSPLKIEQTIIAVFFHDLGLSVTLEETHGTASKDMCIAFFRDNRFLYPAGFDEILDAIEKHDEKSADLFPAKISDERHDLLHILKVCDDLDAFGYTGIYRYAEIYMLRGIPDEILADRVSSNLQNRHEHFSAIYGVLDPFTRIQENRFRIAHDFYSGLNDPADNYPPGNYRQKIIDMFREKILLRENILAPGSTTPITEKNEKIQEFFSHLRQENDSWPYP